MNIIKYLYLWYKARFSTLPLSDFCTLCAVYSTTGKSKLAAKVLQTYFARNTPDHERLQRIYDGSYELKWLYLQNISRSRRQTDEEQHYLVTLMPVSVGYGFPSALREPALKTLFDLGQASKICAYVRDYSLPAKYEQRLISLCREEAISSPSFKFDSFKRALLQYLQFAQGPKMEGPDIQLALLALNDEELITAMVENCTLERNLLWAPALRILADQGSLKSLQTLFFHSFILSEGMVQIILQRFPQLKYAYEISCLRRPLYKLERQVGKFWGTAAPTMEEHQFIVRTIACDAENTDRNEFVQKLLLPALERKNTTPYFCAWATYTFPETGEKAYQKMRKIAKMYRDRYKKKPS
ncbi:MAG: hypothetical protein IJ218_00995 [Alphaproteobacteria bacterium]|nr:hypothetical protein [Alphaproteobacteria bacterium]